MLPGKEMHLTKYIFHGSSTLEMEQDLFGGSNQNDSTFQQDDLSFHATRTPLRMEYILSDFGI
jgi:hypothetical protein